MPGSGLAAPAQVDVAGKESGKALGSTWRCGSGKTVEAVLLQARRPGSFIAWGRAWRPAAPQTPAPALPALQGGPGPAAASSSGSLLGFPWETKGDGEDGGAGRAGGGSRVLGRRAGPGPAAALTPSAFTPPQLLPPSPGHGLPPRPAPPGMWHNREQLSWFRCCMETQLPCQGSRAAAVAVQPPTAPTACGSTRKRVSQPGKCPHSAGPPPRRGHHGSTSTCSPKHTPCAKCLQQGCGKANCKSRLFPLPMQAECLGGQVSYFDNQAAKLRLLTPLPGSDQRRRQVPGRSSEPVEITQHKHPEATMPCAGAQGCRVLEQCGMLLLSLLWGGCSHSVGRPADPLGPAAQLQAAQLCTPTPCPALTSARAGAPSLTQSSPSSHPVAGRPAGTPPPS